MPGLAVLKSQSSASFCSYNLPVFVPIIRSSLLLPLFLFWQHVDNLFDPLNRFSSWSNKHSGRSTKVTLGQSLNSRWHGGRKHDSLISKNTKAKYRPKFLSIFFCKSLHHSNFQDFDWTFKPHTLWENNLSNHQNTDSNGTAKDSRFAWLNFYATIRHKCPPKIYIQWITNESRMGGVTRPIQKLK